MGAYDDPKLQNVDFSFLEKGVQGLAGVLLQKKQQRVELKKKIDLRKTKLIEQELDIQESINTLPAAQGKTFDDKLHTSLSDQVKKVHALGETYATSGDVKDYEKYANYKSKLESSIPKLKVYIDNMNKDLTAGYENIQNSKVEGADGTWSYSTPEYAIKMANNWAKEGGSDIGLTFDLDRGDWNFNFKGIKSTVDGKETFTGGTNLNNKEWITRVGETGNGLFKTVSNTYITDDKKIFAEITGSQYKGVADTDAKTPTSTTDPTTKITTTKGGSRGKEDWKKANEKIWKEYNNGDYNGLIDAKLDANRWEAQQNYSKFGPYKGVQLDENKKESMVSVIKDANGAIVGYKDSYGDDKDTYYRNDGSIMTVKEITAGVETSISQLEYFRDQTWNKWVDQYGRETIKVSDVSTKTMTAASPE